MVLCIADIHLIVQHTLCGIPCDYNEQLPNIVQYEVSRYTVILDLQFPII